MRNTLIHLALLAGVLVPGAVAQTYKSQAAKYPPVEEYLMPQPAGIALAKSAGPSNISDRATIKVLTASGFSVVHQGDNGFVCMVMRGFSAPMYTPQFIPLNCSAAYPASSTAFQHSSSASRCRGSKTSRGATRKNSASNPCTSRKNPPHRLTLLPATPGRAS